MGGCRFGLLGCGGFADLLTMWFSCLSMVRFGVCCLPYLDSAGGWLPVSCFGLWIVVCYCTVFYCAGLAFVMDLVVILGFRV